MKTAVVVAGLVLAFAASPALADPLEDLYNDALAEAAAGQPLVDQSDWQFRDGNVQEGCSLMEQGRVHYEKAYMDMQQMDEMVNDAANGYGSDVQQKIMDWIAEQKATLDPMAKTMADTYFEKCAPQ